jgi:hypothetical protein
MLAEGGNLASTYVVQSSSLRLILCAHRLALSLMQLMSKNPDAFTDLKDGTSTLRLLNVNHGSMVRNPILCAERNMNPRGDTHTTENLLDLVCIIRVVLYSSYARSGCR